VRADVAGAAGDEHGASFHGGSHVVVLLGDDGRSGVGWDGAGGRRRDDAGFRTRDECGRLCVSVSACAAGRGCARVCVWRVTPGSSTRPPEEGALRLVIRRQDSLGLGRLLFSRRLSSLDDRAARASRLSRIVCSRTEP
jgi:hypothetical protein